jgi:hypothetical protein
MNFNAKLLGFCSLMALAATPTLAFADCQSRLVPAGEVQECTTDPRATWTAAVGFGLLGLSVTEYSGVLRAIQTRGFDENQQLIDDCAVVLDGVGSDSEACSEVPGFHETTMVP